jgi:threonyl-tRNA synthetase
MAHAVKELFPETKLAIGPAIEDGFYYDFDLDRSFAPEDLIAIEKKMSEIIKRNTPFVRKIVKREEAIDLLMKKVSIRQNCGRYRRRSVGEEGGL